MDLFLIIVLGIVVFALWQKSQSSADSLRDMVDTLQRQIDALTAQIAIPQKKLTTPPVATPTSSIPQQQPVSATIPAQQPPKPVIPTPPPEVQAPIAPPQQPQPWFDAPVHQQPALRFNAPIPPPPASPCVEPTRAAKLFSLEETFGANWLNKLGVAILVVGLAFFLAYKLETVGPAGKVLCGYSVSLALLAGGVWLERKDTYRIFARAGIGGGWALTFFTTFAMYHLPAARVVHSLPVDLVLMLLVAAGMVAHSLRYRSQTVTGLAFLLGFVTLLTSHLEAANGTVVFSLTASALLAIALVVVTTQRHWAALELAGLVAVYLTHFVWLAQVLPDNRADFTEFWPSTCLILLYWLIFRLAYVVRTPQDQKEENLSSLSAVLNSGGVLGLLKYQSAHPEWAFWALAALGAIEMALAFYMRPRRRQAFVVLSTIATVLLVAAVPFRFHGVSWPVLWLVEAQVLALCGLRLGEPVFRRLGLLAGVVTGAVLALHDLLPIALSRLEAPDPSRHWSLTVALTLAAILYWTHAEVYPRRWPQIAGNELEKLALQLTSCLGVVSAAAALWVVLPAAWVVVGWLALVVLLGFAADWASAVSLALQADVLAVSALLGLFAWNLWGEGWWNHRAPLAVVVALLYAGMRRRTVPEGLARYVAPAYSWAATLLLAFTAADFSSVLALTPAWVLLGLALFELGRSLRIGFLRWQGYLLVALAFVRYFFINLPDIFGNLAHLQLQAIYADHFSFTKSLLLEILILAAAGYWLLERTRTCERTSRREQFVGLAADALGTLSIALWFAFRFPSHWVPVPGGEAWVTAIWAAMATVLLALAWLMHRGTFQVQAIALAVAVVLRGIFVDLIAETPRGIWHGTLFHLTVAALILIAALPFAFRLRAPEFWAGASLRIPDPLGAALRRPEQWFFFAPFGLMIAALAVKLSSGHITIAWSLLGLGVFLFAIVVGERSYRLAGLALLLVSVVKILLMDVWALSPPDRYMTLIILGLALLSVSFLYTRFSAVIRRFL